MLTLVRNSFDSHDVASARLFFDDALQRGILHDLVDGFFLGQRCMLESHRIECVCWKNIFRVLSLTVFTVRCHVDEPCSDQAF